GLATPLRRLGNSARRGSPEAGRRRHLRVDSAKTPAGESGSGEVPEPEGRLFPGRESALLPETRAGRTCGGICGRGREGAWRNRARVRQRHPGPGRKNYSNGGRQATLV